MTPLQILSWIKEALVVGAIGWVVWFLYHSGGSAERVKELQSLANQIKASAAQAERAQKHVDEQVASISAAIDKQHKPVLVYVPGPVRNAPETPSEPAKTGPVNEGPGTDVRPGINEFEKRYETALAECRGILEAWPK